MPFGITAGVDAGAVPDAHRLMGQEHVGAGLLHQILHAHVHVVALLRVELDLGLRLQLAEFGAVPALPVPHADLVGREPLGGEARVGLHGEAADVELDGLPGVAGLLVAEAPIGAGIVLADGGVDADLGKQRLHRLRRAHAAPSCSGCRASSQSRSRSRPSSGARAPSPDRSRMSALAVADEAGRDDAGGGLGGAEIGGVEHRRHVDRVLHGAPHVGIVERRVLVVHAHPDIGERRFYVDRAALRRRRRGSAGWS